MKKVILTALLIITVTASLMAVDIINPSSDPAYSAMTEPYQPLTARALGMGGAGIAVTGSADTFFINPAALASRRLEISLPSAQVTMYHIYDLVSSGLIDDIASGETPSLNSLTDLIKTGYGKIADVDAAVSFTAGGFGLGINTTASFLTYNSGANTTTANIIGKVNAAISLGYGYRFNLPLDFSIDVGAMVRFNYLAYTQTLGAESVLGPLTSGEGLDFASLLSGIPIMAGYSIPFDVGLNVNMPLGFSAGVVARNLNGKYYMTGFDGYERFLEDPFGGNAGEDSRFEFSSDWSLDAGIGWSLDTWYLSPSIAVDVRDIVGLCQTEDADFRDFMYHLNVGAELRILSFLDIRGGLRQGYWTLGVGLDLWAVKLDIAYFRQEFGATAGDYGLDGLTVRVNIGLDR